MINLEKFDYKEYPSLILSGIPINNLRNVKVEKNDDGTFQLWFNTYLKRSAPWDLVDVRMHIFHISVDGELCIKSDHGRLYEIEVEDGHI